MMVSTSARVMSVLESGHQAFAAVHNDVADVVFIVFYDFLV